MNKGTGAGSTTEHEVTTNSEERETYIFSNNFLAKQTAII